MLNRVVRSSWPGSFRIVTRIRGISIFFGSGVTGGGGGLISVFFPLSASFGFTGVLSDFFAAASGSGGLLLKAKYAARPRMGTRAITPTMIHVFWDDAGGATTFLRVPWPAGRAAAAECWGADPRFISC